MKTILALTALILGIAAANAQSVSVRIISNDGTTQATNSVALSSAQVSGLLSLLAKDSATKVSAGQSTNTFSQFIFQELTDKAQGWQLQAGRDAIKSAGVTNDIPDRAALRWFTLSSAQQTNVVGYLNQP